MLFCFDMVRPVLICFLFLLQCIDLYSGGISEAEDKVLLRIGEENIYLSEFNAMYDNVSNFRDCSRSEYFYYFLTYKLKVYDAERLGLDSVSDVEKMRVNLKTELLHPDSYGNDEKQVRLLTYRVRQDEELDNGIAGMKDICSKLETGVKVDDICRNLSDSRFSCISVTDETFLLNEIKEELGKIKGTGHSLPFVSPEGVHVVVKCIPEVKKFRWEDKADDALLAAAWDKYYSDNMQNYSEDDLKVFFKANKKRYRWELPHYKGAVIHCKSRKYARKIKKELRRHSQEEWSDILYGIGKKDSRYDAVMQTGLFSIGENEYIDKLVFKCGNYKPVDGYPYSFVVGKCLDYMPDSYKDVYDIVVQDYILKRKELYFERLEREFRVEKYIDVLKTVNSDGSN